MSVRIEPSVAQSKTNTLLMKPLRTTVMLTEKRSMTKKALAVSTMETSPDIQRELTSEDDDAEASRNVLRLGGGEVK